MQPDKSLEYHRVSGLKDRTGFNEWASLAAVCFALSVYGGLLLTGLCAYLVVKHGVDQFLDGLRYLSIIGSFLAIIVGLLIYHAYSLKLPSWTSPWDKIPNENLYSE